MMKHVHHIFWFWLPPLGYMIAIFGVSSLSQPRIGGDTPDYVLHTLEYFVLALLLIRLLLARHFSAQIEIDFALWKKACIAGMLFAAAYGVTDEIHQYFVPGRHCSLHDVLADTFGAFLACGVALLDYVLLHRCQSWRIFLRRFPRILQCSYAGNSLSRETVADPRVLKHHVIQ